MNLRNRKLVRTVQIIFGVFIVIFGLIGYFVELPAPQYNEAALAFFGALFATGYMLYLISIVFVLSGLMFIFDRWSAFGAILLVPVTFNILMFHLFLDFTGFGLALIPVVLNIYLLVVHWPRYEKIFAS